MSEESAIPATKHAHAKLPRLPKSQKIQKRPLVHRAIANPRTSSSTPKIIYVTSKTPFMSSIKRLRKLLGHIEARSSSSNAIDLRSGQSLHKQIEQSIKEGEKSGARREEVVLKATGRAIERLVNVAVWAQEQPDLKVNMKTGSVGAIDDIVARGEEGEDEEESSRIRRTSCLEVLVGLR